MATRRFDVADANITVVHRPDSSGTTYLWSEFLSRSNPEWKAKVGAAKVLNWPIGVADVGNEGVASSVQQADLVIGAVPGWLGQLKRGERVTTATGSPLLVKTISSPGTIPATSSQNFGCTAARGSVRGISISPNCC